MLDQNPWLAKAIFDAYSMAKTENYQFMKKLGWVMSSLPWFGQELDATIEVMGKNFWPYGISENQKTLKTLFRYSFEQGLCQKELTIEELFYPASVDFTEPGI